MKICVIGTGYVGLVAGTCFAEMGNTVICVDKDVQKLEELKQGRIPIFEPGLEELIISNVAEKRLSFSPDLNNAVKSSSICFIAVGTPQDKDGNADLTSVFEVAKQIAQAMNEEKIIVNKSTVPVGTAEKIEKIIMEETKVPFQMVSNPEFLKQGAAVEDFLKPERVIIGSNSKKATSIIEELYSPFVKNGNPIITMDVKSAEMSKYAANSFLALKISYINEIANICEQVGADIDMVRKGLCSDSRIGNKFLFPGIGYGGSCFPKDVKALIKTAKEANYDAQILKATDETNQKQRQLFIKKIINKFDGDIQNKTFAVWGLAFKPKTNDMREAPSITIINELVKNGAKVKVFDPKATEIAEKILPATVQYKNSSYETLEDADALLILTEWNEFKHPDFDKMKNLLNSPIIFDGRNQYDKKAIKELGFDYICIGK